MFDIRMFLIVWLIEFDWVVYEFEEVVNKCIFLFVRGICI